MIISKTSFKSFPITLLETSLVLTATPVILMTIIMPILKLGKLGAVLLQKGKELLL